ncbi:MAG: ribonuclease HI [Candidatus Pelagibacter sp.]|nr:ribonuclease HI [Candidatus Pelagibacter sp.]OUV87715.1 MAG: ribonuclease HI [Pelagibacteraceae bacterium TMED136]|tara:strand:+ start:551 stop:964 length:414 start_codon:yes stop_codon:yes gene_type:complete
MIKIYTDGACSGNPGRGGWAAIIIDGQKIKKLSGASENTTNNRMELTAVISALKYVKDFNIELFTDSKYTKDGIQQWIINWKKNGWKTTNKQKVKNIDLWQELDELNQKKKISWNWVKGHANDMYNNMADELAKSEI